MRSITAAAERLNIAQPALTRQVKALEEELGVELLRRHGRGVTPTDAGELLASSAARLLDGVEQMISEVAGRDGELRGTVTLGLPPALAETLTVPLVDRFMSEYPHAMLRVASGFTGHVRDWLQRGTIDLGITYEFAPVRSARATSLLREQLYLVGPPGDGTTMEPVTFASACERPFVLPSPAHGLRQIIDLVAAVHGAPMEVVLEIDVVSAILFFVERGMGRTILSMNSVEDMCRQGRLTVRPIVEPELSRTLVLWVPELRQADRLIRHFSDILVAHIRSLAADDRWPGMKR